MATLSFDGIEKRYGDVAVLHRVDLDVADGEFVVLVGPSGCGKSTLLRCVAGLEDVSAGDLRIGGRRVNEVAPRDRDVAMVFQSYALYPHMTVRENMGFALRLRRAPDTDARVDEAARQLGLGQLLNRYPRELSGGQRQRVAMGRAIVRRPQVFLFDEPLSNLDASLRTSVRVELKRQHEHLRTTTLYVTHDQTEALTLADRIVVLNQGVVQQVGTPDELYQDPANRFVAGFIGSPAMNFLERLEPGAVVGVRPEAIRLGTGPLSAEVEVVERLGHESHVHLRLGGEAVVARVEGAVPSGRVQLELTRILRFDPASGRRIE
ncbi:MAG: ATP-binding cassette domain-containing protein [Myxococcales bacterium]|nr:ATP-binding cassette domain-containing protein [Myxococcales bacterium]